MVTKTGKIKGWIEFLYGKGVKNRMLKMMGTFAFIVFVLGFAYFMIFNFNWNEKDGVDIKSSDPSILKGGK